MSMVNNFSRINCYVIADIVFLFNGGIITGGGCETGAEISDFYKT